MNKPIRNDGTRNGRSHVFSADDRCFRIIFDAEANEPGCRMFGSAELERHLTAILEETALAPGRLELELTTREHGEIIDRLRALGALIAIDDFRTKYSSLDYIRTYHVSRLKIPQTMINAAARDPGSAAAVRAIVSIARELDVEVVAQGVETKEQWSFLTATYGLRRRMYNSSQRVLPRPQQLREALMLTQTFRSTRSSSIERYPFVRNTIR